MKNRFVVEDYQNPFRESDHCWRLIDTITGEEVGSDGGEPEDQLLIRDWRWVPEALNHYHEEWSKKVEQLELGLAVATNRLRDTEDEIRNLNEQIAAMEQDGACPVHGTIHGGEAEALRKGIENLLADGEHTDEWPEDLQRLLDSVDARDSLAYLEGHDKT